LSRSRQVQVIHAVRRGHILQFRIGSSSLLPFVWELSSQFVAVRKKRSGQVSWFNHHRLLEPIGYIPPAEAEANYYRQLTGQVEMA